MKRLLCLLIGLCALCTACASQGAGGPSSDPTLQTVPTELLIKADITKVLSAQQIGAVVGVTVTSSDLLYYGTELRFSSEDGGTVVDVSLVEGTLEGLQALCSGEGFIEAPNLPRQAFWHAEGCELLMWYDGYWLSIRLLVPDTSSDQMLVYARSLARTAIENLG